MEKEEKKYKEIELRSEEVQEVMGEIPPWILRWGITTLFVIVVALLTGSWFFKYPDTIKAEITVTSSDPPVSIIARSSGKIDDIFIKNNEAVECQAILAVIQNPAKTEDMLELISRMKAWNIYGYSEETVRRFFNGPSLSLGNIQAAYASFLSKLQNAELLSSKDRIPKRAVGYSKRIL